MGVYIDAELAGSIRLSVSLSVDSDLPTSHVFPEYLLPVMRSGRIIVDPTRFVASFEHSRLYPELPYVTLRLPWMAMEYFDADIMLAAVRPEHQAFYQRIWGNQLVCEPRHYPSLHKPVSLSVMDFRSVRDGVHHRLPFFCSTSRERQAIFRRPRPGAKGEVKAAPLLDRLHCC